MDRQIDEVVGSELEETVDPGVPGDGIPRRTFIGWLIAGTTLIAGADLLARPGDAQAAVPTYQAVDNYDLSDLLSQSCAPTNNRLTITVNKDGTATFELPRAEVGQGIQTGIAMVIADEMDLPLGKVHVPLRDADPALQYNQLTGGSNSMHSLYDPVRTAAASAKSQMMSTAADHFGVYVASLRVQDGVITAPDGRTIGYGDLAERAAVSRDTRRVVRVKAASQRKLVGQPTTRIDQREIVTGAKRFAMDIQVPGALPTMVCRAPTINGYAIALLNEKHIKAMPGVHDVAVILHAPYVTGGVAVRADTFGQCIDAIREMQVKWAPGTVDDKSDATVLADLKAAELPLSPPVPGQVIDRTFTFSFRPGDPLEPNCAIADVRPDRAEIWSTLKSPIWAKQEIAQFLNLPSNAVTVHVTQGGGSFGRHLFCDAAYEAAAISQKFGKPVKLQWARTDSFRQGRVHPMCTSRVRVVHDGTNVLAFDQRHTSVATDFSQGLGDLLTAQLGTYPQSNYLTYAAGIFELTVNVPYNFGPVTQALNEVYAYDTFNTSSVRNIYNPEVTTATELIVDELARAMGKDPMAFRKAFVRDARLSALLNVLARESRWGRRLPHGVAQGIGIHSEYKSRAGCVVEIDTRPQTVRRKVRDGYTGPRVTRATFVVDAGLPINPRSIEAQMMGGIQDGIAQALTFSLHLKDGYFLEGSWDNAYYTRQWNVPPELKVIVLPATTSEPGGIGELGVPCAMAATACAVARATGKVPEKFPINHDKPLGFEPYPTVPPLPQSPTDGLKKTF